MAACLGSPAHAQRRDFPATYRITEVSEQANQVQLTLTVTLRNFSGADIRDCTVTLNSIEPQSESIGSFPRIELLPSDKDTAVTESFTLTTGEYAQWKLGANPNLKLLVPENDGSTRSESIDARREIPPANAAQ